MAILLAALVLFGSACDRHRPKTIGDLVVTHPLPLAWQELASGLHYAQLSYERESNGRPVVVAAVRIDPARYRFRLLSAPELMNLPLAYVHEMSARAKPVLAFNASFYLPETFRPIGLVVSEGQVKNPWQRGAGSGVFVVRDGQAAIEWAKTYDTAWSEAELALQSNPLVVEPGGKDGIYSNTEKLHSRTAVGLDPQRMVVVVATRRQDQTGADLSGLDLYELMQILKQSPDQGGLGLAAALNFDGGISTALSINHPKLQLEIRSVSPVANAIAIDPR